MAKKKSTDKKKSTQDPAKPQDQLSSGLLMLALVSLIVMAASFAYLGLIERSQINQGNIMAQARTMADSQVSLLDQALAQLRLRINNIAQSQELLTALEKRDTATINRFQQELTRSFPEAISAKLIAMGPLGIASLGKESEKLRNNIELDILRHASNGDAIEPEAYKFEDRWLFSLATAIKAEDKKYAGGALLISLDEKYLRDLLSQLDSSLGTSSLIQKFSNKQHIIASTGKNTVSESTVVSDTSISHWQLTFTPSAELITTTNQSPLLIWILMGLSTVTLAGLAFYTSHSLHGALTRDQQLLDQGKNSPELFALPGFAELATKLAEKAKKIAEQNVAQAMPELADLVDLEDTANVAPKASETSDALGLTLDIPADIPELIFRAYDIRGIADTELTDAVVYAIGLAVGSEALDQGQQSVVVAADGRHSSPRIRDALVSGLLDSGRDVIDIGIVPTPLMYFATHQLNTQSGVMITGSHNPAEYNGIKVVVGGRALSGEAIDALRQRILNKDLASGKGELQVQDVEQSYIDYIINDVAIAQPLKIVIDAGNGVAGAIAPRLFEELGCEIIPLYCDVDGDFPNHHPDPTVAANLQDLITSVKAQKADLGIAFDGDGDRLGVVTASGAIVPADRLLMLLAQDVVSRNPGADVLFDVKCTRNLNTLISNYGGRPIMWKTGHSYMKEKMVETGALLGGEFSGHIFFKERWFGFDDGMYAAARLIEILSTTDPDLDLQLEAFPDSIGTPEIRVESSEDRKFHIIEQLVNNGDFGDGKLSTLDGIRVDFPDGWGLVRASNTTPMLVLRFEADTNEAMQRIQNQFKEQLASVDNSLQLGF